MDVGIVYCDLDDTLNVEQGEELDLRVEGRVQVV